MLDLHHFCEIMPYMGIVYARDIVSGRQFLIPRDIAALLPPSTQPLGSFATITLASPYCTDQRASLSQLHEFQYITHVHF